MLAFMYIGTPHLYGKLYPSPSTEGGCKDSSLHDGNCRRKSFTSQRLDRLGKIVLLWRISWKESTIRGSCHEHQCIRTRASRMFSLAERSRRCGLQVLIGL